LKLPDRELRWLDRIEHDLLQFADESHLIDATMGEYDDVFLPAEYGL